MGKHAKLKEKQKWSNEKLHLENARKLRGIYFIDPEDKEFKETIKNARKKLETSVAPAMPCKIMKKNCGSGGLLAGQSVISRKPTAGRAGMGSAQAPSYDTCGGCQAHRGNQQSLRAKAHEALTSDHRWTEHRTSDSSSAFTRMTRSTAHCTRTSSLLFRMMNH